METKFAAEDFQGGFFYSGIFRCIGRIESRIKRQTTQLMQESTVRNTKLFCLYIQLFHNGSKYDHYFFEMKRRHICCV